MQAIKSALAWSRAWWLASSERPKCAPRARCLEAPWMRFHKKRADRVSHSPNPIKKSDDPKARPRGTVRLTSGVVSSMGLGFKVFFCENQIYRFRRPVNKRGPVQAKKEVSLPTRLLKSSTATTTYESTTVRTSTSPTRTAPMKKSEDFLVSIKNNQYILRNR